MPPPFLRPFFEEGAGPEAVALRRLPMSQDLMGAVVKPGAAAGAEWKQAPVPQVGPDDIPIQVKAASICGTDLHIHPWDEWAGRRIRFPQTVGHQTAGEVVEVVKAVSYRARVPGPHSPAAACRSGDAFRVRSGSI